MKNSFTFLLSLLLTFISCKKSAIEEMNAIACECIKAEVASEELTKEHFDCFEFSNYKDFEEDLLEENSELTKEGQGQYEAELLINYSIKNCSSLIEYFGRYRLVSLEKNRAFLENKNLSAQVLSDSSYTSLKINKTQYGAYLFVFNENEKAKEILNQVVDENPNDLTAKAFIGWLYERDDKYEEAIKIYKDLAEKDSLNYEYKLLVELAKTRLD